MRKVEEPSRRDEADKRMAGPEKGMQKKQTREGNAESRRDE